MSRTLPAVPALAAFQLVCALAVSGMIGANLLYLLLVRRVNPVALFTTRDRVVQVMDLVFTAGILVFFGRVLLHALGYPQFLLPAPLGASVFEPQAARPIGVAFVVVAVALFAAAYRQFGAAWRVGIDEANPGALITSGLFRLTRNPIYLAADFYVIGTFLLNGTVLFLLFAALSPVFLHVQILFEERALRRIHGRAFADYCRQTGRYWRVT